MLYILAEYVFILIHSQKLYFFIWSINFLSYIKSENKPILYTCFTTRCLKNTDFKCSKFKLGKIENIGPEMNPIQGNTPPLKSTTKYIVSKKNMMQYL